MRSKAVITRARKLMLKKRKGNRPDHKIYILKEGEPMPAQARPKDLVIWA